MSGLTYGADVLLLVVRLYWGLVLVQAGWHKLIDIDTTADFFASLGIIWPSFSAVVSGCTEFGCGLLLAVGLASRIAAVLLVVNMLVAFATAHASQLVSLFSAPHEFVTAPPFLFLFASLLVLVFGPGAISLDALLGLFLARLPVESRAARGALNSAEPPSLDRSRREFAKLAAAAVAGLIAGLLLRRGGGQRPQEGKPERSNPAPAGGEASMPAGPPGTEMNLLVHGEPHVCRGLNTCKALGKDHKNACAGQGACATAEAHACNGLNSCKGQGGCDGTAGINQCRGKGACAVPLKDEVWRLARSRLEQLAKTKQIKFGAAPAKAASAD